jgi:hypothetical protein
MRQRRVIDQDLLVQEVPLIVAVKDVINNALEPPFNVWSACYVSKRVSEDVNQFCETYEIDRTAIHEA